MKTYKYIKINNEYLNKDFINKYGIDSILILSILLRNYTVRGEIVFNLNYLFQELNIAKTNSNRMNKIKQILNFMGNSKIFNTNIDFMKIKNDEIIKVDYKLPDEDFTLIYDYEVDTILNADTRVDKYAMFYLYIFMKYRINPDSKVMFWSIDSMCEEMNCSNKTVLGYIDMLIDLGLIKKANIGTRVIGNNVKTANNIYTLTCFEDADDILQGYAEKSKQKLEERNIKVVAGKKANKQTSIKLRMNNLQNKHFKGNITKIEYAELEKLEQEYYQYIKHDGKKINETTFIALGINNINNTDTSSCNSNDNIHEVQDNISIQNNTNDSEVENKLGGLHMTNANNDEFSERLAKFKEEQIIKNRNSSANNDTINKVQNNTNTEGNNFSHNSKVKNDDEFLEKLNKFKAKNNKVETVVTPSIKYNF